MIKQIFGWLREQIEEKSVEVNNVAVVGLHNAIVSVNRAELKWEKDCCEWTHKYLNVHKTSCGMAIGDYHKAWEFCPYCGKPIKIVEVE